MTQKKYKKIPPPVSIFLLLLPPENANYHLIWLIFIITYFYDIDETKNRKLKSLIDGETIDFSYSVTLICITS